MIRTLMLGAVALDEMQLYSGERHASTDSGVFDDGQVVYDDSGRVVQNEVLMKPGVEVYQSEEAELVYGQNGEITEIENNNNTIMTSSNEMILGSEGEETGTPDESTDEAEGSPRSESESEVEIIDDDEEEIEESAEEIGESESESVEEESEDENVDTRESIRSELQDLLAEEEAAMVKLTKEVELSALEEKRIANKLKDEHVIKDAEENKHHMPNPAEGLLGMNGNGDVVLTTESDNEITNGAVENGHSSAESETEEQLNGDAQTGEGEKVENEVAEPQEPEGVQEEVAMETAEETPSPKPEETKEEVIEVKPRRSTRIKKAKKVNSDLFVEMNLKTNLLEGHHHDVCSVDMFGKFILSAGRDTSLKLWDSSTNVELQSLGGHESTITKVLFATDQDFESIPPALTASTDCSVRLWNLDEGKMTKSIYVYNTVTCMDYSHGNILIGTDGGKMEVYELESGQQKFSANAFEGVAITEVKFLDDTKAVCGGANGVISIFNTNPTGEGGKTLFTLDGDNVAVVSNTEANSEPSDATTTTSKLNMSKINCMAVFEDLIVYGDNGYNIKILDYKKGEVTKIRNNLKEFCPTEALHIGQFQSSSYLFSVGSDVDTGDAYVNIRSLPDLQYMGTIRDIETNSGSVTCFTQQDINNKLHFVTGGAQLRLWNQVVRRGRKRKNSPNGDVAYVPCKYICNFTDPRDSEPETDDNETELESSGEQTGKSESSTERIPAGKSWCTIL
eukprot:TCONS_00016262-protein